MTNCFQKAIAKETTMNNTKNLQILNQLIDELIATLIHEDEQSAQNKPSNKNSYSYPTHLAKTIKEYINDSIP